MSYCVSLRCGECVCAACIRVCGAGEEEPGVDCIILMRNVQWEMCGDC